MSSNQSNCFLCFVLLLFFFGPGARLVEGTESVLNTLGTHRRVTPRLHHSILGSVKRNLDFSVFFSFLFIDPFFFACSKNRFSILTC